MLLFAVAPVQGQAITLTLDSTGINHPDTTFVTVWLTNPADSIAAFQFVLQLNRPDIVKFVTLDIPGIGFDSAGTLVAGWDYFDLRSISGTDFDVKVTAMAMGPAIGPWPSPRPLVRLAVMSLAVPDTMTERVAEILWFSLPDHFSFARPDGSSLLLGDASLATTWVGSGCQVQGDVNGNGTGYEVADWEYLLAVIGGLPLVMQEDWQADVDLNCTVNSADLDVLYCISHSQCPVPSGPRFACCTPQIVTCCLGTTGNVDCDPLHSVDVSDLTALIDNTFVTFNPLCCIGEADISGDGNVDIGDVTALIDFLFISFAPLQPCQ